MRKSNASAKAYAAVEKAVTDRGCARYILRLYITGTSPKSARAIVNIRKICEDHLQGRYDLEVVDLSQNPVLAAGEQIIAAPTLVKELPPPLRRFIGDMSQTERILVGLDLQPNPKAADGTSGGTSSV